MNRAGRELQARGMAYGGRTDVSSSGAAFGRYTCQCHGCDEWMAAGGLRIIRWHKFRGNRASRAYCVTCALQRGYLVWLPGREPKAVPVASAPAWQGVGFRPVRMVKIGSKWCQE